MAYAGIGAAAVRRGPRWCTPPVLIFNREVFLYEARVISECVHERKKPLHGASEQHLRLEWQDTSFCLWSCKMQRAVCDVPTRVADILTNGNCGRKERTKSSSAAEPLLKVSFLGDAFMVADMSMRSVFLASLLNSASNVDRNGLRDMGLLAELERSDWFAGEGKPGEDALLRKGLLEDRLRERPGDGRRSAVDKVSNQDCDQQAPRFRHRMQRNR